MCTLSVNSFGSLSSKGLRFRKREKNEPVQRKEKAPVELCYESGKSEGVELRLRFKRGTSSCHYMSAIETYQQITTEHIAAHTSPVEIIIPF